MHLEIGFFEHFCVQLAIFLPGTIGKVSLEREHTFLQFVLIMNSCFIQYNAPLVQHVNVAQ